GRAWLLEPQPEMAPRDPPIRFRKNVADCWIGLELVEGKYHQVRKMTAVIGHPTVRLVGGAIGEFFLGGLAGGGGGGGGDGDGGWREVESGERVALFGARIRNR